MITGGHLKTLDPLIKGKQIGCLFQENQVGSFPINPLMEEDPLDPLEDEDLQVLKDHLGL